MKIMKSKKKEKEAVLEGRKPTIKELETLLNSEEENNIQILPNGEVRAAANNPGTHKPLTLGVNIGGEY